MLNSLVNVTNETSPEINSALNFLIKQLLVFSLVQTTTLISFSQFVTVGYILVQLPDKTYIFIT